MVLAMIFSYKYSILKTHTCALHSVGLTVNFIPKTKKLLLKLKRGYQKIKKGCYQKIKKGVYTKMREKIYFHLLPAIHPA